MPLPFQFISGETARSAQVNANFQYIMDMLGQMSSPGQIQPLGSFVMGPRQTATLSGAQDVGGYENDFFQISWNATWTHNGSAYVFGRKLANVGGTAVRIGIRGLEVLGTNQRTGDMNTQMGSLFRVWHEDAGKFMHLPPDMAISTTNSPPTRPSQRRLTTVLLDTVVPIYKMTAVAMGTTVLNAYNYGIPRSAAAIIVNAHVTAASGSGAGMFFFKQEGPTLDASHNWNGMVAHAPITGTGMGMRSGNQGIVPLGTGAFAGNFYCLRTERFELANVYIIGYLV